MDSKPLPARPEITSRLARDYRAGDPQALEIVRIRVRRMVRFRGYGIPAAERQDLEQEVMTQVWQAVNRPTANLDSGFWGLIETVTARRVIDWLRRRRDLRELGADLPANEASPLRRAMTRERRLLAAEALAALPQACRELISLQVGDGMSYREISDLLGKSEGSLRVQMHRCIQHAKTLVEELEASGRYETDGGELERSQS